LKLARAIDPGDSIHLLVTALGVPLIPIAALAELVSGATGRGGTIAVLAARTAREGGSVP